MPYVKVGATKTVSAVMRYCEEEKLENREVGEPVKEREGLVVGGVDCNPETAMQEFKASRICWDKDKGVQAHLVVQSFEGEEVAPDKANELGQEFARKYAPGHQAVVYTHTDADGGNTHNHIVINSVRLEDGMKFKAHDCLYKARELSDTIAKEHGLSIIEEHEKAQVRYHRAEQALMKKGITPWKDEIRNSVDEAAKRCQSMDEFKTELAKDGIAVHEHGEKAKNRITYENADGKKVRSTRLGAAYEWEGLNREFSKQREYIRSREFDGRESAVRTAVQRFGTDHDNTETAGQNQRTDAIDSQIEQREQKALRIGQQRKEAERAQQLARERARQIEEQQRLVRERQLLLERTLERSRGHDLEF